MVVSVDRVTAVRMYDKVQRHWQARIDRLMAALPSPADPDYQRKAARIAFMQETDMAVVISSAQGEVAEFRDKGLDILPHRRRMVEEELDEQFKDPTTEDQRKIAKQLSEAELAVFDLLTRPGSDLTDKEAEQVRKIARNLLARLKDELVLDWRKRQQARAKVRHQIATMLDELPEKYDLAAYRQKCEDIYQHIYEAYYGEGRSVYSQVA